MDLIRYLKSIDACEDGIEYIGSQSPEEAWNNCDRGDWMLFFAQKRSIDLRVLTKVKVECVKLVEHLMTSADRINSLRVAERFADGKATKEELKAVSEIAAAAAYAADVISAAAAAADAAVSAAAAAADAASYAADAIAVADSAPDYSTYSTYVASINKKRKETLKTCADICRKYITFESLNIK